MKQEKNKNLKQGFTLLELLVVVLIIGILAAIALPQYKMAVTKAKVASILPLMRRWKDALMEYNLQHGYYADYDNDINPRGDDLGVSWPNDWSNGICGDGFDCSSDYWYCMANEEATGYVYCYHEIDYNNNFQITMYQPDEPNYEDVRGMTTCQGMGIEGNKVCKALGGKLLNDVEGWQEDSQVYKLN